MYKHNNRLKNSKHILSKYRILLNIYIYTIREAKKKNAQSTENDGIMSDNTVFLDDTQRNTPRRQSKLRK